MYQNSLIPITNKLSDFDFTESFSDKFYIFKDILLAPIINLAIKQENRLGIKYAYSKLEFAYLIFTEIQKVEWMRENINETPIIGCKIINQNTTSCSIDYLTTSQKNKNEFDIKVTYNACSIYVSENSRIRI